MMKRRCPPRPENVTDVIEDLREYQGAVLSLLEQSLKEKQARINFLEGELRHLTNRLPSPSPGTEGRRHHIVTPEESVFEVR